MTDIRTIAAYTDLFRQPRKANELCLIQYTLQTTGGSSGSPVFDADGNVIGLNSAADVIDMINDITPIGGCVHVVVDTDHKPVVSASKVLVAGLNRPGLPIQVSAGNYQVKDNNSTQSRNLEQGEHVQFAKSSELQLDDNGVVTAVVDRKRFTVGFGYGQSVDMLRELLDSTAESKQAAQTEEWEKRVRELHLLKSE